MTWLLIAYLLGLLYFSANPDKISNRKAFRTAWIWFTLIPISNFVFALFRAGNVRSKRSLALVEVWSNGIAWLLFGISLFILLKAFTPNDPGIAEQKNAFDS